VPEDAYELCDLVAESLNDQHFRPPLLQSFFRRANFQSKLDGEAKVDNIGNRQLQHRNSQRNAAVQDVQHTDGIVIAECDAIGTGAVEGRRFGDRWPRALSVIIPTGSALRLIVSTAGVELARSVASRSD
jgi:hypothetical protein